MTVPAGRQPEGECRSGRRSARALEA